MGGVFTLCRNAIASVDKNIALVYTMITSLRKKDILVFYRMPFFRGSNSMINLSRNLLECQKACPTLQPSWWREVRFIFCIQLIFTKQIALFMGFLPNSSYTASPRRLYFCIYSYTPVCILHHIKHVESWYHTSFSPFPWKIKCLIMVCWYQIHQQVTLF